MSERPKIESNKLHFEVFNPSASTRIVKVRIQPAGVRRTLEDKIKEYQKEISLPGFRRGKVPTSIIRSRWLDRLLEEVKFQLIDANTPTVMEQELVDKKTVVTDSIVIKKDKISEAKGLYYEIHMKTVKGDSVVDFTKPALTVPTPAVPDFSKPPQDASSNDMED